MKPSPWPDHIDDLLAKSQQHGGETLAAHTWDVLCRLADLYRLRPSLLPDRQWHCLYWAAFLHDFGKAAHGFQRRLKGGPPWPHRHEVLSLGFVDAIAHDFSEEEQRWLVAAMCLTIAMLLKSPNCIRLDCVKTRLLSCATTCQSKRRRFAHLG
jgi:CRISPR-associated helicase, Cas3 family